MEIVAKIIGISLLTAGMGVGIGYALFGGSSGWRGISSFVLACIGAIVGALAGTAREIAAALRQKPSV